MNVEITKNRPMQVAVIGRDGDIKYRELGLKAGESQEQAGKIVFPFESTNVHSDAWKASEHTVLKKRTDRKQG